MLSLSQIFQPVNSINTGAIPPGTAPGIKALCFGEAKLAKSQMSRTVLTPLSQAVSSFFKKAVSETKL